MSSAVIRKGALDSVAEAPGKWFDESLNVCEEADLFYRIAHDWEVDYVDQPLTMWRVHEMNTTFRKFGQFADETMYILEKHRKIYSDYDQNYPNLVELLKNRSSFQKAISLWRENRGLRSQKNSQINNPCQSESSSVPGQQAFFPGSLFDLASKLLFLHSLGFYANNFRN